MYFRVPLVFKRDAEKIGVPIWMIRLMKDEDELAALMVISLLRESLCDERCATAEEAEESGAGPNRTIGELILDRARLYLCGMGPLGWRSHPADPGYSTNQLLL
jgi:hypothetical protein